ncbi:hypothetical protein ES703_25660 [subsurface metagenome]
MNREEIKAKMEEAINLTQDIEEPYKSIAIEVIFKKLIEEGILPATTRRDSTGPATVARMQASEFLASLDLRSQLDQFEAVAYYFLHSGQESVTRAEIMDTLSKARLPRPKNASDVIGKCIRRGHIIEAAEEKDGQKALQITHKGEMYIEEKFKPEAKL